MYNIKPKLSDNTWEEIIYASENNCIPDTWKIGDEIDLTLSGIYNESVTLQIWDFNHYDKSDGSGKAGVLFGMKNLMKDTHSMNTSNTNVGGWNDSYMRNIIMKDIYNSIPIYIRNHIKEVNTYANKGEESYNISLGLLSKDKVFIPGLSEIYNDWYDQNKTEQGQSIIYIFKDKNNRIKKLNNGSGDAESWWTRSPYCDNGSDFCGINSYGNVGTSSAGYNYGICFCFNI